jgi:hypothetical protein
MTKAKNDWYTLTLLNQYRNDYEKEHTIDKEDFIKILTKESACDQYVGIRTPNNPVNLKRFSLNDFYYDLLVSFSPVEKKLIQKEQCSNPPYLYSAIQQKLKVSQLESEFYYHTTLIYAELDIGEHWNHSKYLTHEQKNNIIFTELFNQNNITSYHKLTKIFTPDDFVNAAYTLSNHTYNLQEYCLFKILTDRTNKFYKHQSMYEALNHLPFKSNLNNIFKESFSQTIKIDKNIIPEQENITNYSNVLKVRLFNLKRLNDDTINNIIVQYPYPDKSVYNIRLMDAAKLNFATKELANLFNRGKALGLNSEPLTNLDDLLDTFKKDSFLSQALPELLKQKSQHSINPLIKNRWSLIFLTYNTVANEKNYKKHKI